MNKTWIWLSWGKRDLAEVEAQLHIIAQAGIRSVLLAAPAEKIRKLDAVCARLGLELHAWYITLCRSNQQLMQQHPDWFMVNRLQQSTITHPPYVGYYRWLCPSKPQVRSWLLQQIAELADIPCVAGVHLDYIRYPDVILPAGCQPLYNLVQTHEEPQYDFCYCPTCRDAFAAKHGLDPLELAHPHAAWLSYRYQTITALVKQAADVVHQRKKKLTAAVFATPAEATALVRQQWHLWPLDAAFPMIYHTCYDQPLDWVVRATAQCRADLPDAVALYPGLYIPGINSQQLTPLIDEVLSAGASGVSLFDANAMHPEHFTALHY
jgi:uncharacterized lipoprotein YddW (UPF0748 family)